MFGILSVLIGKTMTNDLYFAPAPNWPKLKQLDQGWNELPRLKQNDPVWLQFNLRNKTTYTCITQVNSAFRMDWLVNLEVISQVLFISKKLAREIWNFR